MINFRHNKPIIGLENMGNEANFALQWLDYLGNQIYNKDRRILKYDGEPNYDISKLTTKIKLGAMLGDENEEIEYTTMSYQELQKRGMIVITDSSFTWRPRQRHHYKISWKTRVSLGIAERAFRMTQIRIQFDADKRSVRLIGENVLADPKLPVHSGIGKWVVYDK